MNSSKLRVLLDARLISGKMGGIEQVVIGMASGLSSLSDGEEEYIFLAYENQDEFIRQYVSGPCRIFHVHPPESPSIATQRLKRFLSSTSSMFGFGLNRAISHCRGLFKNPVAWDDIMINAQASIIHFLKQDAFLTNLPSIYQPHDLQHRHLPEMFSQYEYCARENMFRTHLNRASMVAVTSSWGKQDLIDQYDLTAEKIYVVPWAPVIGSYKEPSAEDLHGIRARYTLPENFVFYPAQTWPHKNHAALFKALSLLRNSGIVIPLVCSGRQTEYFKSLVDLATSLGIGDQVSFIGFISSLEINALYRLCKCVVIPSLFEAASFPLWEAFLARVPAACSNVTSLPAQAGKAALLFDPGDHVAIADAVQRLWTDKALRDELVSLGQFQVGCFSWERTCLTFRAHYRRISGRHINQLDEELLHEKPRL